MAMDGMHEGMVFGKRLNEIGSEQQGRHEMGAWWVQERGRSPVVLEEMGKGKEGERRKERNKCEKRGVSQTCRVGWA